MNKLKYKIKCFFNYHDFIKIKDMSEISKQLKCIHCQKLFLLNISFNAIVKWDKTCDVVFEKLERFKNV